MPTHDVYVDPFNGDDSNNGFSPQSAKRTVPEPLGNRRLTVLTAQESARLHGESPTGDKYANT